VLNRHRDLAGRRNEIWIRRGLFGLVCLVPVLALANLFGQRPAGATATGARANIHVYAPTRVRGGLLFEARFTVSARSDLKNATLVLGPGWMEGMTINTIEPAPTNEGSSNGRLTLELGHVPAGQIYRLFVQFQVNPTNVGRRTQTLELRDGDQVVASLRRTLTVYP
jgi:hypothetical protein